MSTDESKFTKMMNSIKVNEWIAICKSHEKDFDDDNYEEFMETLEEIADVKNHLGENLYYTNEDSRTIVGHLLWLWRDVHDDEYMKIISKQVILAINQILKYGFDVNNDVTIINGKEVPLITPVADLMMTDGITNKNRIFFLKKIAMAGADFHKNNIWDGDKYYDNYLDIYKEWAGDGNYMNEFFGA